MRTNELADDYARSTDVITHAIIWSKEYFRPPSNVCCIYATAPFVQVEDIKRGLEMLKSTNAADAFSVTTFAFPTHRAIRIIKEQRVEMFQPEYYERRSQDLEEARYDAGQFYLGAI